MKHFVKSFILLAAACLVSFSAYAQNTVTLKLRLVDEKTAEPVSYATVSVTRKGEDKAAKYVLSDIDGYAELSKIQKNTYIVKAELMGYKPYSAEMKLDKNLDLGAIKMAEDVEVLHVYLTSVIR